MRMSTKGRYGLRIMMDLAARGGAGPVLVDDVERSQGISGKYIRVLIGGLRRAGLIRAARGRNGGISLARDPAAITLLEIVEALEGPCVPVECVVDPGACSRAAGCAARGVWCEVAAAIGGVLARRTLADLAANRCSNPEEVNP